MLTELEVGRFLEELASDSPTPGGGSVAAVSGSMGAGFVSMVCRLTIGKKGYETVEALMTETLDTTEKIRGSLSVLIDEDTNAFNQVMAAFRMPKGTPEEKEERLVAIQAGFKKASEIPHTVAQYCLDILERIRIIVGKANSNTLSDLGVAAQTAYAGVEGAVMNVRINLPSIKDTPWAEKKKPGWRASHPGGKG
ncbi:MAG: cyclodeaminase/cyclohydrolase family protein [Gammaproteobacteria bacterium]